MLRLVSTTAAGLFLTLASACATNSPTTAAPEPAAQPQQTAAPAPAAEPAQVTQTAPAAVPATANPDAAPAQLASALPATKKEFHPDDMVCRIYEVTGTRVSKQRICKTRQQWVEDARLAREQFRDLQAGPAQGQSLDGAVKPN